ncbi:hypothetical protein BKA63DRAFT_526030 [Paraphoma chrysanthemicola]|nr:hypothetical protein BKA63DRAFT_526030 [Paraphoma chrysanthemicola]
MLVAVPRIVGWNSFFALAAVLHSLAFPLSCRHIVHTLSLWCVDEFVSALGSLIYHQFVYGDGFAIDSVPLLLWPHAA